MILNETFVSFKPVGCIYQVKSLLPINNNFDISNVSEVLCVKRNSGEAKITGLKAPKIMPVSPSNLLGDYFFCAKLVIVNVGENDVIFSHEDPLSQPENQISDRMGVRLAPLQSVTLLYLVSEQIWIFANQFSVDNP
jgi:hypothetical protein